MQAWAIFLAILFGSTGIDEFQRYRAKKIPKFRVGQTIYLYEDYMNNSGKIITVISNGEGFCRGQLVRKIRLPFQSYYKEIKKEDELDSCTGEVYHNGKWTKP